MRVKERHAVHQCSWEFEMKLEQRRLISDAITQYENEDHARHMPRCRLPGNVLKNTGTGQCVHPYGGRQGEGVKLTYWPGCDPSAKMSLEFLKLGKYFELQSYVFP